jgi:hypothetical protein
MTRTSSPACTSDQKDSLCMDTLVIVLAVLGCIFGLLGFVAAAVTAVIVIGWKNSTHKIQWVNTEPTREEIDAPPEVRDQLPSSPEPVTLQQWVREQQMNDAGAVYDQDL